MPYRADNIMENNMNKIIATIFALGVTAGAAHAQGTGLYVGAGATVQGASVNDAQWGGTATVGYRLNRFVSVEGVADFSAGTGTLRGNQTLFGVITVGAPLGSVTPYVLAGVGYGFNGLALTQNDPGSLWTAGAGVRYAITNRWELDARWRRIESFNGDASADRFTAGVNFRF
jgi:opacity protein-like surface antigen